jgi:hypothetical protein
MKLLILSLTTLFLTTTAHAAGHLKLKLSCHLSKYPDQGINVQIIDVGSTPSFELLVAVITSAGNIKPHVIGSFPVLTIPINGAGIHGYTGKDFDLRISSQLKNITLTSGGDEPQSVQGDIAPNFYCR